MNPFDLRGPPFLALYFVLAVGGIVLMYLVSRGLFTDSPRRPTGEGRRQLRDPYLLAYLRGGVAETIKTVAFSLNHRKLLIATRDLITAVNHRDALQALKNPLERAVLKRCAEPIEGLKVIRDSGLKSLVDSYVEPLREHGLVVGREERARRWPVFLSIAGTLLALGGIKVVVALGRGHANILFLVVLTIGALIAVTAAFRRRRTRAGDQALSDQQTLFARLKNRAHRLATDGATDEAVLVAAAFGLSELPMADHSFVANLKRQLGGNSNSSGGCSSGCGGGGGGGCGGGCGGCGG